AAEFAPAPDEVVEDFPPAPDPTVDDFTPAPIPIVEHVTAAPDAIVEDFQHAIAEVPEPPQIPAFQDVLAPPSRGSEPYAPPAPTYVAPAPPIYREPTPTYVPP